VLEKAAERAVDVELNSPVQDVSDNSARAEDLVSRHHDEAEVGDNVDSQPLAPGAQAALFGNGHNQVHRIGETAPDAKGSLGPLKQGPP
jgi:hypothetical protein